MYGKVKRFLCGFGFVFIVAAASFISGVYTGREHGKATGNEDYSDQIKRVFDSARIAIESERARLDSERANINRLRNGLDEERRRFENERGLNKTDREDLLRLEYLIDESIKSEQGI
jgi:hypothetical protein